MRGIITRGYGLPPRYHRTELVDGGAQSTAMRASEQVMAEHTRSGGHPHDWNARRDDVIAAFAANTIETETPIGYEDAWDPEQRFKSDQAEWRWIEATQDNELAPEWLTMRSNGYRGESLDRLIETDDDAYTMKDAVSGSVYMMEDTPFAFELLHGMRRIEAFLKANDERQWHSGHPKRFALVVNAEGKRGIIPLSRRTTETQTGRYWESIKHDLPPAEVIADAQAYREQQTEAYTDDHGRQRFRMKPGTYSSREDLRAKSLDRTLDDLDATRDEEEVRVEEDDYTPNTPCPNAMCKVRGEDCPLCYGSESILHTLGSTLDWPPAGWHEEVSPVAIQHHRKTREAIKRLGDDIAHVEARQRRASGTGLQTR